MFLSRFESIRAGFATAKGDLRLGWISQTKTVITNGKFLASLPRRLTTLQLPKQIVSTLCFNQALLFLPKRSAKYLIATVPKQLVPERIRIAQPLSNLACALEDPSSLFIGDFKQGLLEGSITVTGNSFFATRHDLSMPQVSEFYHHGPGGKTPFKMYSQFVILYRDQSNSLILSNVSELS